MKRYIVGIDLGTSNTVVAWAETGTDEIRVFGIDQLVSAGEVDARPLLPSARYHAARGELSAGDLQLPWQAEGHEPADVVLGTFARALGAKVPGRLVTSAKSWLSHASVDRLAPILPWGAGDDVLKVSPVDASASYLAHVRAAWNARFAHAPLEQQDVVLTVPASFDDGARALTLAAARAAKLPHVRLLEEPQAAFYDWLYRYRADLGEALGDTRRVLICDVGGGTTDLTLIEVDGATGTGEPRLTRVGVGNHLMLGGDNMDLALARLAETRLVSAPARLAAAELSQLVERCRLAKEQLLGADAPESVAVTLLGAGAKLVGGARTVRLGREEVEQIVVDGFFPASAPDELPRRSRSAIVEFGLPYANDAAVTRHIAAFLQRLAAPSDDAATSAAKLPDTLLLNGGVFRAPALAGRLAATLGAWRGAPLKVLHNDNPDVAVARGAVAYRLARAGAAPRIGGGAARSYFLVLDDDKRGDDGGSQGVCLLPRGTEEGHEVRLDEHVFALRLGDPVRFHLVSTVAATPYTPGQLVELDSADFVRLPPIATVVARQDATGARERPVKLTTTLTEVGTLEVHCLATDNPSERWLLEFQLRRGGAMAADAGQASHPALDEALDQIERIFGSRKIAVEAHEVRRLRARLEQLLGPRQSWDGALLRVLFGALWERARRRHRSADHERLWLNLAGYCVRPGFGYPLDEWRVEQLWTLFDDGIQYVNDGQVWSEWWTLWRRAAGGLDEAAQGQLLDAMAWLQDANLRRQRLPFDPAKVGQADMVLLSASLERVPVARKRTLAEDLLARLAKPVENLQGWWAIGRIGARQPFYGSAHNVVPPEVAERWLDTIVALNWKKIEPAAFAAVQIARMTGDRSRDVSDAAREAVLRKLAAIGAPSAWTDMVREIVALNEADSGRMFGESLPAGLKLLGA